jgi:hypothetical protein
VKRGCYSALPASSVTGKIACSCPDRGL